MSRQLGTKVVILFWQCWVFGLLLSHANPIKSFWCPTRTRLFLVGLPFPSSCAFCCSHYALFCLCRWGRAGSGWIITLIVALMTFISLSVAVLSSCAVLSLSDASVASSFFVPAVMLLWLLRCKCIRVLLHCFLWDIYIYYSFIFYLCIYLFTPFQDKPAVPVGEVDQDGFCCSKHSLWDDQEQSQRDNSDFRTNQLSQKLLEMNYQRCCGYSKPR